MSLPRLSSLPNEDFKKVIPGDPDPINQAPFTYRLEIIGFYDSDTMIVNIDLGFGIWLKNQKIRLAGINAYEITRKYGTTTAGTKIGYKARDCMMEWCGADPSLYPHKAKYHWLEKPLTVLGQSIKDTSGKFGRPLFILWKDGNNLNQWLARAGFAVVTWYDKVEYPSTAPIVPPN